MKSLKKNLLYQSAYQLLMVVSPLITSPYIARTLGNEMYGVYSYYFSIAYFFSVFTILGLTNYGNRTIAKIKHLGKLELSKTFLQLLSMQLGMLFIISIIYFAGIPFWGGSYKTNALIEWLYILYIGLDISWFYFGIEEFKTTSQRFFIVKTGIIICILTFVNSPSDLNIYTFIMSGGLLVSSLILWIQLPKHIQLVPINYRDVIKHIRPNLTLFIPVISLALFNYSDKIMLGQMSTWKELGYYTNADKVTTIPMGLINGLGVVMLPRISSLSASSDSSTIKKYINYSIIASVWAGVALCFGIRSICSDFVPFFFGQGYDRCEDLLNWLSIVVIIKALSNVFRTQYLIPMEKDKEFNISVIVAAIINIFFNAMLIPAYGAMGAVIATLMCELIVLILYGIFSYRIIAYFKVIIPSVSFIISGIVMNIAVNVSKKILLIDNILLRLIIEALIGAFVYCVLTAPIVTSLIRKKE